MLVKSVYTVAECWIVTVLWLSSIAFATAAVNWDGTALTLGFGSDDKNGSNGWFPTSVTKSIYGYTGKTSGNNHKTTRTVARGGSSMFADTKRPPKLPSHPWEHREEARQQVDVTGRGSRRKKDNDDEERQSLVDPEALIDALESSSDYELEQEISEALENDLLENPTKPTMDIAFHYENFGPRQLRSIPFLILTPNVDHWKMTAETLASFGYSVFVCERRDPSQERGTADVAKILDGLGWKHAIVVGCDEETTWAMDAAMDLSPRIAGLVLVGDMSEASSYVYDATKVNSPIGPDLYLSATLECPFRIIWDGGDGQQLPGDLLHHRSLVLGGGHSPHRRQPDQVAWTLARFSNEEVIPPSSSDSMMQVVPPSRSRSGLFRRLIPDSLQEFWTRLVGTWQVSERAIAGIILSVAAINVFCYQLNNVHGIVLKLRKLQELLLSPSGLWKAITTGFGALTRGVFGGSSTSSSPATQEEANVAVSDYTTGDTITLPTEFTEGENTVAGESPAALGDPIVKITTELELPTLAEDNTGSDYAPRDSAVSNDQEEESTSNVTAAGDDKQKDEPQRDRKIEVVIPRWADGTEVSPPPDIAEVILYRISPSRQS